VEIRRLLKPFIKEKGGNREEGFIPGGKGGGTFLNQGGGKRIPAWNRRKGTLGN